MFIAPQDETPSPLHSHTDLMRNTSGLFKFRRAPHPSLAGASSVRVELAPVPIFPHFFSASPRCRIIQDSIRQYHAGGCEKTNPKDSAG